MNLLKESQSVKELVETQFMKLEIIKMLEQENNFAELSKELERLKYLQNFDPSDFIWTGYKDVFHSDYSKSCHDLSEQSFRLYMLLKSKA